MTNKMIIEVQYFRGCPNSSEMINRVKEAIKSFEENIEYREILVEDNDLAEKLNFRGSPTVLINGKDLEGRDLVESASLNCRIYENGLPSVEKIKSRLSHAGF
jgi:glutaredoxin